MRICPPRKIKEGASDLFIIISDASPEPIAIDEDTDHRIMQDRRFEIVNRAVHETLNLSPEIHVFALNGLYVPFANGALHRNTTALVGTSPIHLKPRDAKPLQETLEFKTP